jgi:hypothetical protein
VDNDWGVQRDELAADTHENVHARRPALVVPLMLASSARSIGHGIFLARGVPLGSLTRGVLTGRKPRPGLIFANDQGRRASFFANETVEK